MKVKPRPLEAGLMKVGRALESHMAEIGSDWLREEAWLFLAIQE